MSQHKLPIPHLSNNFQIRFSLDGVKTKECDALSLQAVSVKLPEFSFSATATTNRLNLQNVLVHANDKFQVVFQDDVENKTLRAIDSIIKSQGKLAVVVCKFDGNALPIQVFVFPDVKFGTLTHSALSYCASPSPLTEFTTSLMFFENPKFGFFPDLEKILKEY